MADKIWRGDAQDIAQVSTITMTGTVGAGSVTATINLKDITYTIVGTETLAEVATALYALLIAAPYPEFQEIIFTNDTAAVVTATAKTAGVPFTLTCSDTGTITATAATPTASSGRNHLDAADNWGGSLPVDGDNLYFPDQSPDYLYGLDVFAANNLGTLYFYGGSGGLPDKNPNGYDEYRGKVIDVGDCAGVNVGDGIIGVQFLRLKVSGSGTCLVKIDNGQALAADVGNPGVYLTSGGSLSMTISVASGAVGLAVGVGEAITVGTLNVGTLGPPGSIGASDEASAVLIGSGATVTTTNHYSGEIRTQTSTALTIHSGIYTQTAGNIGAFTNLGGRIVFNSIGTMGAGVMTGPDAVLDMSGDVRAVTSITSLSCKSGAYFVDPQKRLGNVAVALDQLSAPLCVWGGSFTLTRS